jgi:hypothetical protein
MKIEEIQRMMAELNQRKRDMREEIKRGKKE